MNVLRSIQWLFPELATGSLEAQDLRHFQGLFREWPISPSTSLTENQLRSIQGLPPVLPHGIFGEAELRHQQGLFSVGDPASPPASTGLTENQLWSIQQMFSAGGLDRDDLRHIQWLFRVSQEYTPCDVDLLPGCTTPPPDFNVVCGSVSAWMSVPTMLAAPSIVGIEPQQAIIGSIEAPTLLGAPAIKADVVAYELRGTIAEDGIPVDRRVRAYLRATGELAGEADSVGSKVRIPLPGAISPLEYYIVHIDLSPTAIDFSPPCINRVQSVLADDTAVW